MGETRGTETHTGKFVDIVAVSHMNNFPIRKFAAAPLLQIAIVCLDFWITSRLIYYPAMAETRSAEVLGGDLLFNIVADCRIWIISQQENSPWGRRSGMSTTVSGLSTENQREKNHYSGMYVK